MPGTDTQRRQNGVAITTFRELRFIKRDDLAKRLGISYPYLANIENEYKDATPALINRIALELEVPVKALLRRPLYDEPEAVSA